jgi:hypothetical protein
MASNGSIIEDSIRFGQNAKQRLVEIAPENAKEILHDNDYSNEELAAATEDNLLKEKEDYDSANTDLSNNSSNTSIIESQPEKKRNSNDNKEGLTRNINERQTRNSFFITNQITI